MSKNLYIKLAALNDRYFEKLTCFLAFLVGEILELPFLRLGLHNTLTASLQRSKTPLTSVLHMILNNLMVRLQ